MSLLPLPQEDLTLAPGMVLIPRAAPERLLDLAFEVMALAPPRNMMTPMGKPMSAAITNCGAVGWVGDRSGYRYSPIDPESGACWPALPWELHDFAATMAARAGYPGYTPNACLINYYRPGARMGMHQDRDERDFSQPIVSISFGASALFRIGGPNRKDPSRTVRLHHGDTLVFGGPARLIHHGIDRILSGGETRLGAERINLTFRKTD